MQPDRKKSNNTKPWTQEDRAAEKRAQLWMSRTFGAAPAGTRTVARVRPGVHQPQAFSAPSFFVKHSQEEVMRRKAKNIPLAGLADVRQCLLVSLDCDIADYEGCPEEWGATREERKHFLYAQTVDYVCDWMRENGYIEKMLFGWAQLGLPAPNTLVYSGHGVQGWWRMPADMGGTDGAWSHARLHPAWGAWVREARAHPEHGWTIDANAKDLGTRNVPVPGELHRSDASGTKYVTVIRENPESSIRDHLLAVATAYVAPTPAPKPAPKRAGDKEEKPSNAPHKTGRAKQVIWHSDWGEFPAAGTRDVCPKCPPDSTRAAQTYERKNGKRVFHCHRCNIAYHQSDGKNRDWSFRWQPDAVEIKLDANGYAIWPELAEVSVLRVGTGAGKTRMMAQLAEAWPGIVISINTTVALSEQAAAKYNIAHASAGSKITAAHGSVATSFARLPETLKALTPEMLRDALILFDECESALGQLASMLAKRPECLTVLTGAVAQGARVLLADAHAGEQTRLLLRQAAEERAQLELPPRQAVWYEGPTTRHQLRYVPALTLPSGKVISSHTRGYALMLERLKAGKRIAAYGFSKKTLHAMAADARDIDKKAICVTKAEHEDERVGLDPEYLQSADVLYYNNAMGSGVSLEKGHYDEVWLFTENHSQQDYRMLEQASHRDRAAAKRPIYVCGVLREKPDSVETESSPEWQMEAAVERFQREEVVAQSVGVTLFVDHHFSLESRRMSWQQATAHAEAVRTGRGWALQALFDRHDVHVMSEEEVGDLDLGATKSLRRWKNAQKREKVVAVLAAEPSAPERAKEIADGDLPESAQELAEYRAHRVISTVGDAVQVSATAATMFVTAEVDGKLGAAVTTVALARCLGEGGEVAQRALKWYRAHVHQTLGGQSKSTIVAARRYLKSAQDLSALISGILALTENGRDYHILGDPRGVKALLRKGLIPVQCKKTASSREYYVRREDVLLALQAADRRVEYIRTMDLTGL
jgi:hypothetical protein